MRKGEKDYLLKQLSQRGKPLERRLEDGRTSNYQPEQQRYQPGYHEIRYGGTVGRGRKPSSTKRSKLV